MTNLLNKYNNVDVENMRSNGGVTSTFDNFGNLLISSNDVNLTSSVITAPLYSPRFMSEAILKVVDTSFSEFLSEDEIVSEATSSSDVKALYDDQVQINKNLQSELDALTIKLNDPEKTSDQLQIRDTIIELRISLGEGTSEEDFSDEFPHVALN